MRPIYYDESLENLESKVNKELRSLWLSVNKLSLNVEQTNLVIFHPSSKPLKYNSTIKILKNATTEMQSIEHLGVFIDSTQTWKDHVSNLSKKLSRLIGVIYKLRPVLIYRLCRMYTMLYSVPNLFMVPKYVLSFDALEKS